MRIGELAAQAGMTRDTIRFYEKSASSQVGGWPTGIATSRPRQWPGWTMSALRRPSDSLWRRSRGTAKN